MLLSKYFCWWQLSWLILKFAVDLVEDLSEWFVVGGLTFRTFRCHVQGRSWGWGVRVSRCSNGVRVSLPAIPLLIISTSRLTTQMWLRLLLLRVWVILLVRLFLGFPRRLDALVCQPFALVVHLADYLCLFLLQKVFLFCLDQLYFIHYNVIWVDVLFGAGIIHLSVYETLVVLVLVERYSLTATFWIHSCWSCWAARLLKWSMRRWDKFVSKFPAFEGAITRGLT